jgi:hypothetical protein
MGIVRGLGHEDERRVLLALDEVVLADVSHDLGARQHLDSELGLDLIAFLGTKYVRQAEILVVKGQDEPLSRGQSP